MRRPSGRGLLQEISGEGVEIGADNEVMAEEIRNHASQHLTHSQATEALFLVHPYFVLHSKEMWPPQTETHEWIIELEKQKKAWNQNRKQPLAQRELYSINACIAYARNQRKVEDYVAKIEDLVDTIDTQKVKLVLVEAFDNYWKRSSGLVERGRFNDILVTKSGVGFLSDGQKAYFAEQVEGIKIAYVGGSYSTRCPYTFAQGLAEVGINVVPVADILFSHTAPQEVMPKMWREKGFRLKEVSRTYQLPGLQQAKRR